MTRRTGTGFVPLAEKERRDLDVDRLRRDIVAMWREEGAADPSRGAVTRACQSTLVVPAVSDDDGDGLVTELLSLIPSRAILIRSDPGRAAGSVESWVGGSCFRREDGGSLVCSEVVHMSAGPQTDRRLASAVRSLRVGGVPLFVVTPWASPLEIAWLDRLGDVVDVVLADSAALSTEGARALWRRCSVSSEPRCGDLQWESLVDWRRAVASWFDRPDETPRLSAIDAVTITTAESPGGLHKGLLLAGWLGSRLGWRPVARDAAAGRRFVMEANGSRIGVEIRTEAVTEASTLIREVHLVAAGSSVRWRRLSRERILSVETGDGRRFRLNRRKISPSATMLAFLRRPAPDPVARDAMLLVERMETTA